MNADALYDAMCRAVRGKGFVYLVNQINKPHVVKIGWSRNPFFRVATLRTGSAEHLGIAKWVEGSRRDEAFLHKRFSALRVRGEWFHDADGDIHRAFDDLWKLWLMEAEARLAA